MFLKDIKNSLNSIHQQFTKMRNEKKSVILTPDIIEKKHPDQIKNQIPRPKGVKVAENFNITINNSKITISPESQKFETPSISKISFNSDRKWSGSDQCERDIVNDDFFHNLVNEDNKRNSPVGNLNATIQPKNIQVLKIYQDSRRSTYIFAEGDDEEEEVAKFRAVSFAKKNSRLSFLEEQRIK